MSRHNRGHAIFLSRQPLIILQSKLYSVCPSKYQDHSKPLKHLPVSIWSTMNTFTWLIPVMTSPKLQTFIQDGGHLVTSSENISRTNQYMKNRQKKLMYSFKSSFK